jgi:pilus assembly protein CpaF
MGLLERLEKQKSAGDEGARPNETVTEKPVQNQYVDEYRELKEKAHKGVIEIVNKKIGEKGQGNLLAGGSTQNDEIFKLIEEVVESQAVNVNRTERSRISKELYDEVMGYGPLENLLKDDAVTEIMVNGPNLVYIEKAGKLFLSDVVFRDNEHVMNIIDRIVSSIGRHVDEASPMVDARLTDGSRVNVIIPPLSLVGPVITIRKFSRKPMTDKDLIRFGSISLKALAFLEACVRGRMNIVVSGGTGSGKTTLLNVLSSYIPENERIVTIEDAAELRLNQRHVITLESRPSNLEGEGADHHPRSGQECPSNEAGSHRGR